MRWAHAGAPARILTGMIRSPLDRPVGDRDLPAEPDRATPGRRLGQLDACLAGQTLDDVSLAAGRGR